MQRGGDEGIHVGKIEGRSGHTGWGVLMRTNPMHSHATWLDLPHSHLVHTHRPPPPPAGVGGQGGDGVTSRARHLLGAAAAGKGREGCVSKWEEFGREGGPDKKRGADRVETVAKGREACTTGLSPDSTTETESGAHGPQLVVVAGKEGGSAPCGLSRASVVAGLCHWSGHRVTWSTDRQPLRVPT